MPHIVQGLECHSVARCGVNSTTMLPHHHTTQHRRFKESLVFLLNDEVLMAILTTAHLSPHSCISSQQLPMC